ncbi:GGDEF domain-containing protein [Vibrio owensii]|uniref:GGDEF domain-containing protein n=1 Tax=Vibrio owensii TaxID=696485 RepID=UPI000597B078|nr:GGDEF domain-containing protein [Vibrio owensii]
MKYYIRNKNNVLSKSIFVSIAFTFLMCLLIFIANYKSNYERHLSSFALFSNSLLEKKQTIFLISKILESENSAPTDTFIDNVDSLNISSHDANLSSRAYNFQHVLSYMNNKLPQLFIGSHAIYYRDFIEEFLIDRRNLDYKVDKTWFTERCLEVGGCAKFSSNFDLNDSITISKLHKDIVTENTTFSLSSPIYNDKKEIIGDINIDMYIKDTPFLHDKTINFVNKNENSVKIIVKPKGDFIFPEIGMFFSEDIDNKHIIEYTVPIEKILEPYKIMSLIILVVNFSLSFSFISMFYNRKETISLMKQSRTDSLTSVYNRHILLSEEFLHSMKNGGSLITIDGNKIKSINDNFGHKVGDLAIKLIANALTKSSNKDDYVIRIGGDEFLIVSPKKNIEDINNIMKKIDSELKNQEIFTLDKISVTSGFSFFQDSSELDIAISNADMMMYKNKLKTK